MPLIESNISVSFFTNNYKVFKIYRFCMKYMYEIWKIKKYNKSC